MKRILPTVLLLALAACGGDGSPAGASGGVTTLRSEDLVVGTGATAASGDTVTVHYVGTLSNGTRFDSSFDRNQPFTFRIGAGQVIAGWEQGVPGLRVGGRRRLTIPPSLGYGDRPNGPIPANSTLIFEIDLLAIAGR